MRDQEDGSAVLRREDAADELFPGYLISGVRQAPLCDKSLPRRESIQPQPGQAKTISMTPSRAGVMLAASSLVTGWTSLSAWWFISIPQFGHVIE
jgi:hypothetical protein